MVSDRVLRLVVSYIWGDLALVDFERALPDGWDLDEGATRQERRLVLGIMGHLADYRRGNLNEASLRVYLAALAMDLAKASGTIGLAADTFDSGGSLSRSGESTLVLT